MDKPTCAVPECVKESYLRGWCNAHYIRNQRYGSPLGAAKIPTAEERFWAKVDKSGDCWNWTAYVMPLGYGQFQGIGSKVLAHRFAYEITKGAIPKGIEVDHVCFNRICVRPDHLRLTTHKQNNEHRQAAQKNSTTGVRGVYPSSRNGWQVKIGHNNRTIYFGTYGSIAEAEAVAIAKRIELFTHNDVDRRGNEKATQRSL